VKTTSLLNSFIQFMNKALSSLIIIIMFALLLIVGWQVFSRYILSNPSTLTEESSRFLLMWLGLLGGAYTFGQKKHLAIDILTPKLNDQNQNRLQILILFLTSFFSLILIIGGTGLSLNAFHLNQITPSLALPMGFIYSVVPISGLSILLYSIHFLLEENK